MSRKKNRKSKSRTEALSQNPFAEMAELIGLDKLPEGPEPTDSQPESNPVTRIELPRRGGKNTTRGRVDIVRQTAHRGGKAVTVAKNFKGIGLPEKKELAKKIQKACGVGGTVKDGCIEIQGDNREVMMRILTEAGFNPVFAGG